MACVPAGNTVFWREKTQPWGQMVELNFLKFACYTLRVKWYVETTIFSIIILCVGFSKFDFTRWYQGEEENRNKMCAWYIKLYQQLTQLNLNQLNQGVSSRMNLYFETGVQTSSINSVCLINHITRCGSLVPWSTFNLVAQSVSRIIFDS